MDIVLVIVAFLFLLAGLFGSVVPALPGPPLGFAGLLLLQWSGRAAFTPAFLWVLAGIAIAVTVMDSLLPALMAKRFGGSRKSMVGSVLGLVIGMIFFAPVGLLLGPFLGALAGELLHNCLETRRNKTIPDTADAKIARNLKALKVALGAFLAFILGTGAKLAVGLVMIYYAVTAVFS